MAKKVVTLYIDDSSLRLLVAKGNQVKKWANVPLESRLVRDGVIFHEAKLAAKIKELLKAQRVRSKKVVAGLSGLHCLSRAFILPQLSEAMLAEAVKREAERTLPLSPDQFYLSWQIISTSAKETQVFLAALPRNATDALIETLRLAGVKPYLIDLAPLALARVVNMATAIIVDVRSTEFDIVIMKKGVPHIIRSLSFPSGAKALHEKLTTVREELGRTIDFYNSSQAEKPLEPDLPIFACGGLAEKPKLCQSLSDELERPVLPLTSPLKCPEGFAPSQYMVNIGLALKELTPGKEVNLSVVDLNALPEVYRRKPPRLLQALIVPTIIVMAIAALFPLLLLLRSSATDIALLQAELNTTNQLIAQRVAQRQSQNKVISELENKVAELEEINNAFATVRKNFNIQRGIIDGDLQAATNSLPSTSDFIRVSHASVELTISGKSPDETTVLAYANALRASGRFSQVIVSLIQKTEEGVSFTLTLTARE